MKIWVRPSRARIESNKWLKNSCKDIKGDVLSIGSASDTDCEKGFYKDYFKMADSYTTSEVSDKYKCDLTLDIRSMPEIKNESYDCIYCSGVLEHVDDYHSGLSELTRVLKTGGILLLGLPFRQAIHVFPHDFWRFTEFGIKHLLHKSYSIVEIAKIDVRRRTEFPASYWVKAIKL